MKLNYKRTLLVGFAFFLICAFWQAYDAIIPKILTDKFGLAQTLSGVIMALDNVLALFLLPLFGTLSDKTNTKRGRRTPFIFIGTIIAAVALVLITVPDNAQRARVEAVGATEGTAYEQALDTLWEANPDIRVEDSGGNIFKSAKRQPLQNLITEAEFKSIEASDKDANYAKYVVPARQSYAASVTAKNPGTLVAFVGILLVLLVAMGVFRSPAVALMPDVTVKPLRSKANAIINLMGAAGGIIILGLGIVFGTGKAANALMSYTLFFSIVAGIMLVSLLVFMLFVKEPQWASEMAAESERLGLEQSDEDENAGDRKLSKAEFISLMLILFSVVFWYMGYNAVTSKYSVYAGSVLNKDYNTTLLIANAAAIVSYLPIGLLSSKFGRKKMILTGVVVLAGSFLAASFLRSNSPAMLMNVLFATAGIGWATINVNSYPMVVELSRGSNVGRYTGFYYTASMAAQVVTPVLSGVFLDIKFTTLFPYATVFVILAFFTMLPVRHGDARPAAKQTMLDGLGGGD